MDVMIVTKRGDVYYFICKSKRPWRKDRFHVYRSGATLSQHIWIATFAKYRDAYDWILRR